jgi:hypothetical protein
MLALFSSLRKGSAPSVRALNIHWRWGFLCGLLTSHRADQPEYAPSGEVMLDWWQCRCGKTGTTEFGSKLTFVGHHWPFWKHSWWV